MSPAAPRTSATDNTNFTKIALKDQASIETGECAEGAKFSIGWRSAVARLSRWAGVLVGFLIFATCLIAQTQFGSFAVGVSSGAVSVNVMAIAAGSVSNIDRKSTHLNSSHLGISY